MERKVEYRDLDSRVLAVAVEGAVEDWSAYVGAVNGKNHDEEYEEVASNGSKLPQKIAELLFPDWAEKLVWRR